MKLFNNLKKKDNIENVKVEYILCLRCEQEVFKELYVHFVSLVF